MKRQLRKSINDMVARAQRGESGYKYRGRHFKTKTLLKAAVIASMEAEAAENKKLRSRRSVKALRINADTIKDMRAERAERDAQRPSLATWGWDEKWYIAVCKYGFGIDNKAWKATRLAQEHVPVDAKPSQLVVYRHDKPITPTGFITWPNGEKPSLFGLTNTHQGWQEARR